MHNTASLDYPVLHSSGNPSHSLEACFLSSTWLDDLDDHRYTSDWRTDPGLAAPGMAAPAMADPNPWDCCIFSNTVPVINRWNQLEQRAVGASSINAF